MVYKEIQAIADWIQQERMRGVEDEVIVNYVLAALLQWLKEHEEKL